MGIYLVEHGFMLSFFGQINVITEIGANIKQFYLCTTN